MGLQESTYQSLGVDDAAKRAEKPTEAQAEAGNYKKGHTRIAGLAIAIENEAGSKRRPEWPALKSHYGYIKGTIGKDKDHVDVFVHPGTPADYSGPVHVVNQRDEKTNRLDEHKVMLGWHNAKDAAESYRDNYSGKDLLASMATFPHPREFRDWLERGDMKAPAEVKPVAMY